MQDGGFENVSVSGGKLTIKPGDNIEPDTSKVVKIQPQIGSNDNKINVGKAIEIHVDVEYYNKLERGDFDSAFGTNYASYGSTSISGAGDSAISSFKNKVATMKTKMKNKGYNPTDVDRLLNTLESYYSAAIKGMTAYSSWSFDNSPQSHNASFKYTDVNGVEQTQNHTYATDSKSYGSNIDEDINDGNHFGRGGNFMGLCLCRARSDETNTYRVYIKWDSVYTQFKTFASYLGIK